MLGERRHEALRIQTAHEADVARVMVPEEFAVAGSGPAAGDEEAPPETTDRRRRFEVSGGLPRRALLSARARPLSAESNRRNRGAVPLEPIAPREGWGYEGEKRIHGSRLQRVSRVD